MTLAEAAPAEPVDPLNLVVTAARAADDKQGRDTVVLEVGEVLSITSWFVVTSASNSRAVRAIVDHIEEKVDEAGGPKPNLVEGRDSMQWVLMSYPDFVVHVFDQETRDYYELERLWRDVPTVDWASPETADER